MPTLVTASSTVIPGTTGVTLDFRGTGFNPKQKVTVQVDLGATDFVWRAKSSGILEGSVFVGPTASVGQHRLDAFAWRKDGNYAGQTPLASATFSVAVSQPPVDPPPTIDLTFDNITEISFRAVFHTSEPATGIVRYRVKGSTSWITRLPMQSTVWPGLDQAQVVPGSESPLGLVKNTEYEVAVTCADAAGNAATVTKVVKTIDSVSPPPPPPSDPTRVLAPDTVRTAAELRSWLGSQQGKKTALQPRAYALGGTISFDDLNGVDLDLNGCPLLDVGVVGVGIRMNRSRTVAIINSKGRTKLLGRVRSGYIAGHYYTGLEHDHSISLNGAVGVRMSQIDTDTFMGDGVYGAHWGTQPSEDIVLDDVSFTRVGRMVFGLVAARGWQVTNYRCHDVSYTIVDVEPEYYGSTSGTIQMCVDLHFKGGKSTGWVGKVHQDSSTFYDYAVAIQMGTPSVVGDRAPQVDGIEVDGLDIASANKGAFTRVGQGNYRMRNVAVRNVTGRAWPWPDPVFLFEGVDTLEVANLKNPHPNGASALVRYPDCTQIRDLGGHATVAPAFVGFAAAAEVEPLVVPTRHSLQKPGWETDTVG